MVPNGTRCSSQRVSVKRARRTSIVTSTSRGLLSTSAHVADEEVEQRDVEHVEPARVVVMQVPEAGVAQHPRAPGVVGAGQLPARAAVAVVGAPPRAHERAVRPARERQHRAHARLERVRPPAHRPLLVAIVVARPVEAPARTFIACETQCSLTRFSLRSMGGLGLPRYANVGYSLTTSTILIFY